MNVKRITTEDGSDSLYVPDLEETFHSQHGAIQESNHVFINNGLNFFLKNNQADHINILEFGFGTGLNALLTFLHCIGKVNVSYTTLEKYPIELKTAVELNYGSVLKEIEKFERIITCDWDSWQAISVEFNLRKVKIDFRDYEPSRMFDLIYYDAFAPSKQPELWSIDILKQCYNHLNRNGVFVTYSAKGQLRRDLESLGFKVDRLPGPPGKFEMIRAIKT